MRFADRVEAGRLLGERLRWLRGQDLVVLGLPRGGVPVAWEVAQALNAPLDVIVVRKLGVPWQPELAMGAVGENGVIVRNEDVVRQAAVSERDIDAVADHERVEVARRAELLRGAGEPLSLRGRTAVIVDDGIATGATARAACEVAREAGARRVLVAVPVAPPGWARAFVGAADESVCLMTPEPFLSVGQWYEDFRPTTDNEVVGLMAQAAAAAADPQADPVGDDKLPPPAYRGNAEVLIPIGEVELGGSLTVPESASGIVLFAHGSGSSRCSPRNQYVARVLNQAGLATVLFDLLTVEEEQNRSNVFDIKLLAERLVEVTRWVQSGVGLDRLPVAYFGASTGAAAALWAAAEMGDEIAAVVSRGGRPDLATEQLDRVVAPTLLIVGQRDPVVVDLNTEAQSHLRCPSELAVVPHATHLFEEPGALEEVALLARGWFSRHFVRQRV
jgi:putative phosphoribosyl transferase